MKVYYSPQYTQSRHAFDTTRKAQWIADSLCHSPVGGVEVVAPAPLTTAQARRVHAPAYVEALTTGQPRDLAGSQGFEWDPGLWTAVAASNGGVLAAARSAVVDGASGSLSSGLHHAHRDYGSGFCSVNGLAVAATLLLDEGTVSRVLVLDLDAHHGGGTDELVRDDSRIFHSDVSVDMFDHFECTDTSRARMVHHANGYLPAIAQALGEAEQRGPFDVAFYNAGVDPYEGCDIGGLDGVGADTLARREQMVFDWCQRTATPVAFVLAGGYVGPRLNREGLVGLHRLTISTAARVAPPGANAQR